MNVCTTDAQVTEYVYDEFGRLVETIQQPGTADEIVTKQEYDEFGRVTAEIDAIGLRTEFDYDPLTGRLIEVRLPDLDGNPGTTDDVATYQYAYDEWGNQVSLIDPNGHESTWVYEENREQSRTLPDGSTESYTYDEQPSRPRTTASDGSGY